MRVRGRILPICHRPGCCRTSRYGRPPLARRDMRRSWGCYRPVCRCPSTVPFIADGTPPVRSSTLESGGAALIPINHKPNPADPIPSTPITAKRRRFNCRTRANQINGGRTCVLGYLGCGAIPSIRSVYIPTPGKTLGKNYMGMETR
jgi:hypothetical protein